MPIDNGKVMTSWGLVKMICSLGLSAPTTRLLFSMLHQLDISDIVGCYRMEECPTIWASCSALRERVGPKHSKSAREVIRAVQELQAADAIKKAHLLERNTKLQWQFSDSMWSFVRDRDWNDYVLVDLEELGNFQSLFAIKLYLASRKVYGARAPQFTVLFDKRKSESANVRQLLSGLSAVSPVVGVVFYAGLVFQREQPLPEGFEVKCVHKGAQWKHNSYLKFSRAKIWRVDGNGHTRLDPKDILKARADPLGRLPAYLAP